MSIDEVNFFTVAFPGEAENGDPGDKNWNKVGKPYSFKWSDSNTRVLSQNGASPNAKICGILYVPDLSSDACKEKAASLIPSNSTRRKDLPSTSYALIALAPWFSPECTIEFLAATANEPVDSIIFFRPDNTTNTPPHVNDPGWLLNDGGSWKKTYKFPAFAIPGFSGFKLLDQLALYSGNVSQVPHGEEIVQDFSDTEFVRIGVDIRIGSKSPLPNLWVFLLIVASMLVVIVCSASAIMHIVQLRRRKSLRRRVRNGEVDLEALGVKKLTVPQKVLEKLPLYSFDGGVRSLEAPENPVQVAPNPQQKSNAKKTLSMSWPYLSIAPKGRPISGQPAFSQTNCSICLDEFVVAANETDLQRDDSQSSVVRELPCRHIFHPSCIDQFLLNNSSLCPVCKLSVLPVGFCDVPITNAMVRRERRIRQLSEQSQEPSADENAQSMHPRVFLSRFLGPRLGARISNRQSRRSTSNHPPRVSRTETTGSPDVEMIDIVQSAPAQPAPVHLPASTNANITTDTPRVEVVQPSLATSLEPQQQDNNLNRGDHPLPTTQGALTTNVVDADEEELRAPGWKRFFRRLFPA